ALQLVRVDAAELRQLLAEGLARRHRRLRPCGVTRARYSSREKTPFSISSSTIALSAATERRCVSSTPRSSSTALVRGAPLPVEGGGADGGAEGAGAFFGLLRGSSVTTDWPLLLTTFIEDCSPSSPRRS